MAGQAHRSTIGGFERVANLDIGYEVVVLREETVHHWIKIATSLNGTSYLQVVGERKSLDVLLDTTSTKQSGEIEVELGVLWLRHDGHRFGVSPIMVTL